jgi:hypothetical protein
MLSCFILSIVLPVIKILTVFILNIYIFYFYRFSMITLICVNGIIIPFNSLFIIIKIIIIIFLLSNY